jgi:hypothetical protein
MEIKSITDIKVPDTRLRSLNADKVGTIAQSIATNGLINPITLHQTEDGLTLIAGLHRLEACKSLGFDSIPCTIHAVDSHRAELLEIDENLMRQELTVLEQSEHIQRREEILEAMGLRAKASPGTNQYTKEQSGTPLLEEEVGVTVIPTKTTQDIADEIGLSKNSVQKRKQIATNIVPEVKESLRNTEIANSTTQLVEVARMEPEKQQEFAEAVKTGEVSTVKEFKSKNHFTSLEKSSKTDEHYTPERITDFLYQFCPELDLDPCSNPQKNIKAKYHYTKADDGLEQEWTGSVFVNPPFSEVGLWVSKAIDEYFEGNCDEVIFLSKFDARVGWFKPLIGNFSPFCLVEGYVSYHGNDGDSATFTTAIWYLGERGKEFKSVFQGLGWVCAVL